MRHPTVLEMFITNIATNDHKSLTTQNWYVCESKTAVWLMTEDHTGCVTIEPCADDDNAWTVEYMINDSYTGGLFDYARDIGHQIKIDGSIGEQIAASIRHRIDRMRRQ